MSNLIKSSYVNVHEQEKFIINPSRNDNEFVSFMGETKKEKPITQETQSSDSQQEQDFVPGVNVLNIDKIFEEEKKKIDVHTAQMVEDAQNKVDAMLSHAQSEAEEIKKKAEQTGYDEGYRKGVKDAEGSYAEKEKRLAREHKEMRNELEQALNDLEPKFAQVLGSLVTKLTGVVMEQHDDVLLYLIRNCIRNLDKAAHYTIRVSKYDSLSIETQKSEIRKLLGENSSLDIVEEQSLEKNDCIIETDTQMVDCGIHTQLTNLIDTLTMMTL